MEELSVEKILREVFAFKFFVPLGILRNFTLVQFFYVCVKDEHGGAAKTPFEVTIFIAPYIGEESVCEGEPHNA